MPFAGRFAAFAAALNDVAAIAHDGSAISTRSSMSQPCVARAASTAASSASITTFFFFFAPAAADAASRSNAAPTSAARMLCRRTQHSYSCGALNSYSRGASFFGAELTAVAAMRGGG